MNDPNTPPAPSAAINGISLDRVAQLVSGQAPIDATRAEWLIADDVRKYGAKLEREGYMPQFRRPAMMRRMVELARESPVIEAVRRLNERTAATVPCELDWRADHREKLVAARAAVRAELDRRGVEQDGEE
jgi:hypothetical protein